MTKPGSSQPHGMHNHPEMALHAFKESTTEYADGDDPRADEEHRATPTPATLTATQKKNRKRRAKKKKGPSDVVVLEMTSKPLYEFHRTYGRAYLDLEESEAYAREFSATLPTSPGMSKTKTIVSHTKVGNAAAARGQKKARVIADDYEDLDGLPITDLHDAEKHKALVSGLGGPWPGLLNPSLHAPEVSSFRAKHLEALKFPEAFALLVHHEGEAAAHAIRNELGYIVAEERQRDRARQELENQSRGTLPSSPKWIPNMVFFNDVDSLEGSDRNIVYGYHRTGKDGKLEWKEPNFPGEQTIQQVGDLGGGLSAAASVQLMQRLLATYSSENAHQPAQHQVSTDVLMHDLDSAGFSKPSFPQPIKQTPTKIPVPTNGLGRKRIGGARRLPDNMRVVQRSSMDGMEDSVQSTDTTTSREPRGVAEVMTNTLPTAKIRSDADRARIEAEVDELLKEWKLEDPATPHPLPGSAEMIEIVEDIFEPVDRCTARVDGHRDWLQRFVMEREDEQAEGADSSAHKSATLEAMLAEARVNIESKAASGSAAGGRKEALSSDVEEALANLRNEVEIFQAALTTVRNDAKADAGTDGPVRFSLLSEAKTKSERDAGELAAAQREIFRAEPCSNDARYVHPFVDRSCSVARPHPEARILAMEKKALESLTEKLCRMGSLKEKAGARKSDAVCSSAQSATQKSVASKGANQVVGSSWRVVNGEGS